MGRRGSGKDSSVTPKKTAVIDAIPFKYLRRWNIFILSYAQRKTR
jgi:hypothetical protein